MSGSDTICNGPDPPLVNIVFFKLSRENLIIFEIIPLNNNFFIDSLKFPFFYWVMMIEVSIIASNYYYFFIIKDMTKKKV